ncbi:translation elongation factor Ts [Marinitoga sp. 38H-ov]|uniref:translation elongation factor Ts n=1 Tax=Marinitoga sp. 38H-ov TaxID=1755814 RepID=UPI0013EB2157|nr:translation elongation factor Ts [Marinitoga sp. 38H-ov]KAF2956084.1 elongation factor Ts [Marinitoga sp. 38H-ov]
MNISAADVKKLRDATGAGMMDCKKALIEAEGDFDKAVDILRIKGAAKAAKKAGRGTGEGIVYSYIHHNERVGVLLELNCETDFVARTEDFHELAKQISLQIAAMKPRWVKREDVPEEVIAKEKEIYTEEMKESGKPAHIVEKIVENKLNKFFEDNCLLEQEFVFADEKGTKIQDLITSAIAKIGENIQVSRFARFEIGE